MVSDNDSLTSISSAFFSRIWYSLCVMCIVLWYISIDVVIKANSQCSHVLLGVGIRIKDDYYINISGGRIHLQDAYTVFQMHILIPDFITKNLTTFI